VPDALRIAINHTRLGPRGGVEGYIWTLLGRLLDAGHHVDYFCHKVFEAPEHERFRLRKLRILRSPPSARLWSFARGSAKAIAAAQRERPYDVVHGFGKTWHHDLYRDGSGCHVDYRALYLDAVKRGPLRRALSGVGPYDRVIEAIEARRYGGDPPQLVYANSQWVADQILARHPLGPEWVRVIPSGVDCERFRPERAEAGRALLAAVPGRRSDARAAVFVSNDHTRKGLPELLEALADLKGGGERGLQLLVVGKDPGEASHRARASKLGLGDEVLFCGPRGDLADLLPACDLFCLPTRFDALPNAALEALAAGLPVLTSRQTGAAEHVREGANGWVVDQVDPAPIAGALRAFLGVEDLAPLRGAAREAALALSWDDHFTAVEEAYAEVARRREAAR
jgi:UDP-glucose:(heptosyl)LPS alpha-1,3-glucosyltransferase